MPNTSSRPLSSRIGGTDSPNSARSCCTNASPPMTGISTSSTIRSGRRHRASTRPARPSVAASEVCPPALGSRTSVSSMARNRSSSSMIRMVFVDIFTGSFPSRALHLWSATRFCLAGRARTAGAARQLRSDAGRLRHEGAGWMRSRQRSMCLHGQGTHSCGWRRSPAGRRRQQAPCDHPRATPSEADRERRRQARTPWNPILCPSRARRLAALPGTTVVRAKRLGPSGFRIGMLPQRFCRTVARSARPP
jgi:hypothetical protein